jgi:hypothetical protein
MAQGMSYTNLTTAFFTIQISHGFYGKPITDAHMNSTALPAPKSLRLSSIMGATLVTKCTQIEGRMCGVRADINLRP